MDILFLLASLNQNIESMNVSGTLEFQKYVDEVIQGKMHNMDSSYPLRPNSSAKVITTLQTSHARVQTFLQSSFVAPTERRVVTVQLAHIQEPQKPVYATRMDFDKRQPEGTKDVMQIWNLQDTKQSVQSFEYPTDRM